jgi:hypothetical protein
MLQQPKIHPLLAFEHSGMFSDPGVAYEMSKEYFTEHEQDVQEVPADENQDSAGDSTSL